MKKRILLIPFLLVAALPVAAQDEGVGLGFIVGEPTGVSVKAWLSETEAIDGAAAWSFDGRNSLQLHATYLFHNYDVFFPPQGRLPVYLGIGPRVQFRQGASARLGVRVPVGVS